MKILVIGLDCAAPEILFEDERLQNFRYLMEMGCYGTLESVTPPITVPAWMCMATSQDPGSLGVYGVRDRVNYSYDGLKIANSKSIRQLSIWDQIALEGKKASIIGVPPSYPPRRTSGLSVGCFLTPDPEQSVFTHPAELSQEILEQFGSYAVDVRGFRTENKDWLKEEIFKMSRKQFEVARHYLRSTEWDYFQFVDIGLDRIQHGFWKYHDPQHRKHESGNPYENVIRDYYRHLDEQVGSMLELLTEDTLVLILSDHGVKRLDGGFCINEWLIQEGYLVLNEYPREVTPFNQLDVNWDKTTAWSEGGYYARIFLNVEGREPCGLIPRDSCATVRETIQTQLEATLDDQGRRMNTRVFRPEESYRDLRNIPPDLIVYFGDLFWRSVGSVGHRTLHVQENDTGPDDCNHAQEGAFVLAASGCPLSGEIHGARLLDMAPTLLERAGYDVPPSMQGRPLVDTAGCCDSPDLTVGEEENIRYRLQGLGYI
jgi:predicted AlkP superfamily phosphohydrolase/phosphomutase